MPPVPPYLAPSAPPQPALPSNTPRVRALTEEEKRILREFNATKPKDRQWTEAQYIQMQEMPARDVATTTFDLPKEAIIYATRT